MADMNTLAEPAPKTTDDAVLAHAERAAATMKNARAAVAKSIFGQEA